MIIYLFKMLMCSALFLGAYLVCSQKEKNHQFKRFTLLAFLILPFAVPLVTFETHLSLVAEQAVHLMNVQPSNFVINQQHLTETNSVFDWSLAALFIYLIVTVYYGFRFFKNLYTLKRNATRHENLRFNSYTLVLINQTIAPHSFLNYIFLNRFDYENNNIADEILVHEQTHASQKHSLDVLLVEFIKIFTWFNPFLSFYKKAIQINHEFLADDAVIKTYDDIISYQYLLLNHANQPLTNPITSQFNYLTTKKRLIMMTRTSSKKAMTMKQILLYGFVLLTTFVVSNKLSAQTQGTNVPTPAKTEQQGISPDEMKNYHAIENKYLTPSKNGKYKVVNGQISPSDETTLQKLYLRMSTAQQNATTIAFIKAPKPLPISVPSKSQLESFQKPTVYGVWVDGKHVENQTLSKYQPSDFKNMFISKLYGSAKKGRTYTHQVDLMTNNYYDVYYAKTMARKNKLIMIMNIEKNQVLLKNTNEQGK